MVVRAGRVCLTYKMDISGSQGSEGLLGLPRGDYISDTELSLHLCVHDASVCSH